uniref:Uncharacterized protein n=1 Tax=Vespula pensylvanica TaxID=30213 RepID=A0A834PFR8_VESPE|nr:hypothetical protein H0235_001081 [Vespula pensylvanica]
MSQRKKHTPGLASEVQDRLPLNAAKGKTGPSCSTRRSLGQAIQGGHVLVQKQLSRQLLSCSLTCTIHVPEIEFSPNIESDRDLFFCLRAKNYPMIHHHTEILDQYVSSILDAISHMVNTVREVIRRWSSKITNYKKSNSRFYIGITLWNMYNESLKVKLSQGCGYCGWWRAYHRFPAVYQVPGMVKVLNARLNFKQQVERVTDKATKVAAVLARFMPNISDPRQDRKKLLPSLVTSVLSYA